MERKKSVKDFVVEFSQKTFPHRLIFSKKLQK